MHKRNFPILAIAFLVSSAASTKAGRFTAPSAASGNVEGTISYTGTPPKMKPIDMAKEPSGANKQATPVMTESVGARPGNTLEDVVVYVAAGDMGGPATQPVTYEQKGCQYIPHVAAMEVNQPLEIYTRVPTSHNINPM